MTVLALKYRGDGAFRPTLPPRDLDRSDLQGLSATTKRSIEQIVEEAVSSGLYLAVTADEDGSARNADDSDATATDEAATKDPLEDAGTTRGDLVAIAEELGLTVASRDTKAAIKDAILAERARLAAEGDTGGDGTPADDSDATATDEAGQPPAETPEA